MQESELYEACKLALQHLIILRMTDKYVQYDKRTDEVVRALQTAITLADNEKAAPPDRKIE